MVFVPTRGFNLYVIITHLIVETSERRNPEAQLGSLLDLSAPHYSFYSLALDLLARTSSRTQPLNASQPVLRRDRRI